MFRGPDLHLQNHLLLLAESSWDRSKLEMIWLPTQLMNGSAHFSPERRHNKISVCFNCISCELVDMVHKRISQSRTHWLRKRDQFPVLQEKGDKSRVLISWVLTVLALGSPEWAAGQRGQTGKQPHTEHQGPCTTLWSLSVTCQGQFRIRAQVACPQKLCRLTLRPHFLSLKYAGVMIMSAYSRVTLSRFKRLTSPLPSCVNLSKLPYLSVPQFLKVEWVAFPFSRGSSQPKDRTQLSRFAGRFFTSRATREAQEHWSG